MAGALVLIGGLRSLRAQAVLSSGPGHGSVPTFFAAARVVATHHMTQTISVSSRLALSPIREGDVPELVRVCTASEALPRPEMRGALDRAARRTVRWADMLRRQSGELWAVRLDGSSLIGCALARISTDRRSHEIGIALQHRFWGIGYALDITRALARSGWGVDSPADAESLLMRPAPHLSRITFQQLLALSASAAAVVSAPVMQVSVKAPSPHLRLVGDATSMIDRRRRGEV